MLWFVISMLMLCCFRNLMIFWILSIVIGLMLVNGLLSRMKFGLVVSVCVILMWCCLLFDSDSVGFLCRWLICSLLSSVLVCDEIVFFDSCLLFLLCCSLSIVWMFFLMVSLWNIDVFCGRYDRLSDVCLWIGSRLIELLFSVILFVFVGMRLMIM